VVAVSLLSGIGRPLTPSVWSQLTEDEAVAEILGPAIHRVTPAELAIAARKELIDRAMVVDATEF
jgi:hypothetical protein